jgi:hypothetical protein
VVDNLTGDPITVDTVVIRNPTPSGAVASADMLMQIFESGLVPLETFELLRANELAAYLDLLAVEDPDRVTRTSDGIEFDCGEGTVIGDMLVSGLVSLEDETTSDATAVSGELRIGFTEVAVDGLEPVVGDLELGLELARVENDHMAGEISVGSVGGAKDGPTIEGTLEFDTRICESYPIGGTITVTLGAEQRTVTFTDACDGSFEVDVPSARFFSLALPMNDCAGGKLSDQPAIHLIAEDGRLSVDPASPPDVNGRRRFAAVGTVGATRAELRFVQRAAGDGASARRVGGFRGQYQSHPGGPGYYTGSYGYTVAEGDCSSSYYHGRDDPDFEAGVLQECDGPCGGR